MLQAAAAAVTSGLPPRGHHCRGATEFFSPGLPHTLYLPLHHTRSPPSPPPPPPLSYVSPATQHTGTYGYVLPFLFGINPSLQNARQQAVRGDPQLCYPRLCINATFVCTWKLAVACRAANTGCGMGS